MTEKLLAFLGGAPRRADFDPHRSAPAVPRAMGEAERAALIMREPEYGEILCRCREVTAGEVRDAIRRGAATVDAVKRRTGALMGRCQGSRCQERVLRLLSRELGKDMEELEKDGPGSRVLPGGRNGES